MFLLLGLFWGSSYLFIKIGVDAGLAPLTLVAIRIAIGFSLLAVIGLVSGVRLPRERSTWAHIAVICVLSVALPFFLITWAEQSVDSTLAAVLNGAIPLVVIVLAAAVLPDERLTAPRIAGLLVGFVGLIVLVGFDPATLGTSGGLPVAALIASTVSYAAGGVWARRFLGGVRPIVLAIGELGFALLYVAPMAIAFEGSERPADHPRRLVRGAVAGHARLRASRSSSSSACWRGGTPRARRSWRTSSRCSGSRSGHWCWERCGCGAVVGPRSSWVACAGQPSADAPRECRPACDRGPGGPAGSSVRAGPAEG